ncbi:phage holin family protein [Rubrobacter indicoceani]|uniref:phage holin family protein n=1 Tax=Rubrobacter indicoceani TaxID=2051957 RepID=UPI000E5BDBDB|nr:phage holin family protein [Rubrobacter indicoceani]
MQGKEDRSLGELFAQMAQETSTLVRQEVALAKAEIGQKASRAGRHAGILAVGGAVAYAGFLAIIAGVIYLLADLDFVPLWLAAFVVGLVVAAVGYFLIRKGLDALKQEDLAPRQTMEILKEDQQWIKDQKR